MRDLFIVAKFTIKDMIKRKSFIISTLIILILIVLLFNVPNIIKAINGKDEMNGGSEGESDLFENTKLLIVDAENIFEGTLEQLNNMEIGYDVTVEKQNIDFEQIKTMIDNKETDEALITSKTEDGQIRLEYIVENLTYVSQIPEILSNSITTIYTNLQLSKLGLTPEQIQTLEPNFIYEIKQTDEQEVEGNQFVMMLLSIVLFFAIYFCAYQVSASITTEKTSKIIETLVTSTTPRTIVLGKTLGIGIVGLIQIAVIVATALISGKLFLEDGILEGIIDLSNITPFLGIITAIYFILGYAFYALLYALTGSTVSKPEDVQSANSPIAIISLIGFYLAYFTMMTPSSDLNKVAAILPISSPFCMPFRVMMGIATTPEIAISIAVLLVTIVIIAQISIKIYSQAILNYGSKINFKDMLKMYKNKNV